MDPSRIKFRASSVGELMVGGNAITPKQLVRLGELQARLADPNGKPLTANMVKELEELIEKRDADFEFGATAMACIRECWLRNELGYDEPLITNEMLKGILCEDEAIDILCQTVPGGFRVKNSDSFEDDWFTGTPDLITGEYIEDVKCSWTVKTFMETKKPDPLYYAQGQVYMSLTGLKKFRLAHVLVETPFEIIEEEKKRFYFKFNCNEEDPFFIKAVRQVEAMHGAVARVPKDQRVKWFEFGIDMDFINTLRERVEQARKVYGSITLGGYSG